MFVDSPAFVAILTGEPEADRFADAVEAAGAPITSPIAVFEATLGLCRKRHASVAEALADVEDLLAAAAIDVVSLSATDARSALDAFARYGKGRGHPAQLNLGDCFAYAAARNTGTSLLFKGDDFTKTDAISAV